MTANEFDNVTDEQLDKLIQSINEDMEFIRSEVTEDMRRANEAGEVPADYHLSDLEERKDKLLAEKGRRQEKLAEALDQLAELANQAGAEGVWAVRGAKAPTLIYSTEHSVTPVILDVEEAGALVLIRFPAGDGGEEGIEAK